MAGAGECACDVAKKAYRSWNSLRGLVCDLYLAGYSARAAHRLSYLPSPLGHGKGLGPSVFHRFDIPVLLALPPVVEGFAIFELQARFMARHRGAYSGRVPHVGSTGICHTQQGELGGEVWILLVRRDACGSRFRRPAGLDEAK